MKFLESIINQSKEIKIKPNKYGNHEIICISDFIDENIDGDNKIEGEVLFPNVKLKINAEVISDNDTLYSIEFKNKKKGIMVITNENK